MVFYTCSGCGESLKKNKVDNHAYSCRFCEYVTCMDCSQDFYGDDYRSHTSCITEDQKYAAKGTEFKPNKGDVKQQEWCKQIENALTNNASLSQKARDLLTKLASYDNIPRKQSKFINFVKNSLRLYDEKLCEEAWKAFSSAKTEAKVSNNGTLNGNHNVVSHKEKNEEIEKQSNEDVSLSEQEVEKKKKKKKSKKNGTTAQGVNELEPCKNKKNNDDNSEQTDVKKSKKKRKKEVSSLKLDENTEQTDAKKSKKKKRKKEKVSEECSTKQADESELNNNKNHSLLNLDDKTEKTNDKKLKKKKRKKEKASEECQTKKLKKDVV